MHPLGFTVERTPAGLTPLRAQVLACQHIPAVDPALGRALGLDPARHVSAGLLTCDQDDALYVALDHATKYTDVDVVFARSFYAGAKHGSGPYSGEVLGIVAGEDPDHVAEALWEARQALTTTHFHTLDTPLGAPEAPAFFAFVIRETGRYLAPQAAIAPGEPMAYLIAPPIESIIAIDAALKAADVQLAKHLPPPSETNFGGAFLTGDIAQLEAAAVAFIEAIRSVHASPLHGLRRPARLRR
jgi:ethanolamine utilization protein EutL